MTRIQLTVGMLVRAHILHEDATRFVAPLSAACARFGIDTSRQRMSAFLANAHHESFGFSKTVESLYYRDPVRLMQVFPSRVRSIEQAKTLVKNPKGLALAVYSNRLGNGGPETEDGWDYIGRGLFQLTGLTNYLAAEKDLGRPYVKQPELVAFPEDAALTAAWFWHTNGCNALADRADLAGLTRVINGPRMLGHKERVTLRNSLMEVLA